MTWLVTDRNQLMMHYCWPVYGFEIRCGRRCIIIGCGTLHRPIRRGDQQNIAFSAAGPRV